MARLTTLNSPWFHILTLFYRLIKESWNVNDRLGEWRQLQQMTSPDFFLKQSRALNEMYSACASQKSREATLIFNNLSPDLNLSGICFLSFVYKCYTDTVNWNAHMATPTNQYCLNIIILVSYRLLRATTARRIESLEDKYRGKQLKIMPLSRPVGNIDCISAGPVFSCGLSSQHNKPTFLYLTTVSLCILGKAAWT